MCQSDLKSYQNKDSGSSCGSYIILSPALDKSLAFCGQKRTWGLAMRGRDKSFFHSYCKMFFNSHTHFSFQGKYISFYSHGHTRLHTLEVSCSNQLQLVTPMVTQKAPENCFCFGPTNSKDSHGLFTSEWISLVCKGKPVDWVTGWVDPSHVLNKNTNLKRLAHP